MLNHYDLSLYIGWFEIPHDFIGLPELYGLKCENLITSVIVFVLVLLEFGRFCYIYHLFLFCILRLDLS
jgi:hypothetical protein